MHSKIRSVTMEIPKDMSQLQERYSKAIVKILVKKLSPKQLNEFIDKAINMSK